MFVLNLQRNISYLQPELRPRVGSRAEAEDEET